MIVCTGKIKQEHDTASTNFSVFVVKGSSPCFLPMDMHPNRDAGLVQSSAFFLACDVPHDWYPPKNFSLS
jgi:hypothetical protein